MYIHIHAYISTVGKISISSPADFLSLPLSRNRNGL